MSNTSDQQMNPALLDKLRPVVRRERWRLVLSFLAFAWIVLAIAALLIYALNRSAETTLDPHLPSAWIWITAVGGIGSLTALVFAFLAMPSPETMARRIEQEFPELDSVLLTAIEQAAESDEGLSFFQYDVIQKAVLHSFQQNWTSVVPTWKLFSSSLGAILGLAGICAACLMLFVLPTPKPDSSIHLFDDIEEPISLDFNCIVQPGDTEVEQGTNLLILAEFANDAPPEAELVYTNEAGESRTASMRISASGSNRRAAQLSKIHEPR